MNDPLPSWREGPTRRAIVRFVETVTSQNDSDHMPPPERVAVFDNDGTLWCEKPMVELIHYLGANGFAIYIASGGGRDFMRPVTQEIYGVPRERVIGSGVTLRYVADEHGGRVVREAELGVLDDGPAKPTRIWSRVGRRPILAAGNSNGDIEMLRFAERPLRPYWKTVYGVER